MQGQHGDGPVVAANAHEAERGTAGEHYNVLAAAYPERSCFVFTKSSKLRRACVLVSHSAIFENFIFFIILCNCVTLALNSSRQGFDDTALGKVLADIDYVFIAIFTLEMLLKVVSMGFVLEKGTYLRDGWNVVDFLVVVASYVSLVMPQNLTGLRVLRALRPLRAVKRIRGMRVLVTTMIGSLPMLFDVFVLCAFTFFLFGIIAVQLFAGVLRNRCGSPDFSGAYEVAAPGDEGVSVALLANVTYLVPDDQSDLMCSGRLSAEVTWYPPADAGESPVAVPGKPYHGRVCDDGMYCTRYGNPYDGLVSYDNILWSWLTIFQHITLSGWTDVMYMVMDAVNYWVWIFYVALIIFGAFFMINLALAVLSVNFSTDNLKAEGKGLQEETHGSVGWPAAPGGEGEAGPHAATRSGLPALSMAAMMAQLKQARRQREAAEAGEELDMGPGSPPPPGLGSFRRHVWRVAVSRGLELTTAALILVNTAVMCVNWYGMPSSVESATTYINYGLTGYFAIELAIRMTAFGFRRFFRSGMNVFDFVVVVVSVLEMIIDLVPSLSGIGPLSVLRAFRLLRIFRLARNWRELNSILRGMFRSVQASIMLVGIMLLFLFISSLIGGQLFGYEFMFCDYVAGASPVCPLGQAVWGGCPNHFYCYLPCSDEQYGNWIDAPGSFYNDLAYCDRFCDAAGAASAAATTGAEGNTSTSSFPAGGGCEYLAMVGKSQVPRSNFDNVLWGLYTVFQLLTGDDWNSVMYNGMLSVSPWASLYFVGVIVIGNYIVFNLFIAILLDNLNSDVEGGTTTTPARGNSKHGSSSMRRDAAPDQPAAAGGAGADSDSGSEGRPTAEAAAAASPPPPPGPKRAPQLDTGTDRRGGGGDGGGGAAAARQAGGQVPAAASDPALADGTEPRQPLGSSAAATLPAPAAAAAPPLAPSGSPAGGGGGAPSPAAPSASPAGLPPAERGRRHSPLPPIQPRTASATNPAGASAASAASPPAVAGPLGESVERDRAANGGAVPDPSWRSTAVLGPSQPPTPAAAPGQAGGGGEGGVPEEPSAPLLRGEDSAAALQPRKAAATPAAAGGGGGGGSAGGSSDDGGPVYGHLAKRVEALEPEPSAPSWHSRDFSVGRLRRHATSRNVLTGIKSIKSMGSLLAGGGGAAAAAASAAEGGGDGGGAAAGSPQPPAWESQLEGRSVFLFPPQNRLRRGAAAVAHSRLFDSLILLLILASCVCLVLDAPGLDPHSRLAFALRLCDYVFTGAFTLEAVLKIVAFGFALTGRHAYARSGWNLLDLGIVLLGWALIIVEVVGVGQENVKVVRVLRALRALRPLRAVQRFPGLRVVVTALFAVLPAMVNVALVCLFFYLIFAILTVNLFKGKLYNCIDAASGERIDPFYVMPYGQQLTRSWCEAGSQTITQSAYYSAINVTMPEYTINTQWVNPSNNFDNVGVAMLTLFQAATLSGWTDIAFLGVDAVGVDKQPLWNHTPAIILLFVFFIVVCSFFVLNLFIGVTLEKFSEIQEAELEASHMALTPQQQSWLDVQHLLLRTRMAFKPGRPRSVLRGVMYDIVTHPAFEWFMMAVIVANLGFMALTHVDMGATWLTVGSYSNLVFTCIFVAEAALKLIAFGPLGYFRDGWNCFDFFVVVVSVASVALDLSNTRSVSFMPVLRVARVARVVRLFRNATGMQKLLRTLYQSLPALANVGGVMALFFFIFAVIGVNLFAGLKRGDNLDDHANFDTFPNALLLLFRMITGEGWNGIMTDCMITQGCVLVLYDVNVTLSSYPSSSALTADLGGAPAPPATASDPAPDPVVYLYGGSYLNPSDPLLPLLPANATDNQCAVSPIAAVVYFPVFVVLCTFILLQLIIAVLLENLTQAESDAELPIPRSCVSSFVEAWSDLDGGARGCVHASQLGALVCATDPPLGTFGLFNCRVEAQERLFGLDIPLYAGNQVSFMEVLYALSGSVCGVPLPEAAEAKLGAQFAARLPAEDPWVRHTAAHYNAAISVSAAVRGFMLRHTYRDQLIGPKADITEPANGLPAPRRFLRTASAPRVSSRMYVNGYCLGDLRRELEKGSETTPPAPRPQRRLLRQLPTMPPLRSLAASGRGGGGATDPAGRSSEGTGPPGDKEALALGLLSASMLHSPDGEKGSAWGGKGGVLGEGGGGKAPSFRRSGRVQPLPPLRPRAREPSRLGPGAEPEAGLAEEGPDRASAAADAAAAEPPPLPPSLRSDAPAPRRNVLVLPSLAGYARPGGGGGGGGGGADGSTGGGGGGGGAAPAEGGSSA